MSDAVKIALITSAGTAIVALITGIINLVILVLQNRRKKQEEAARENDAVWKGVRALLCDRIKYLCKKYIAAGAISAEDLEDIVRMHTIYHDELHGNGYLDSLMTKVKVLPIAR